MIPKILITVSGGSVQHIASNMPAEIIIIDNDNVKNREIFSYEPDLIVDESWFVTTIKKANDKIKSIFYK